MLREVYISSGCSDLKSPIIPVTAHKIVYLILITYFISPPASNKLTQYLYFKFCNCERKVQNYTL
jgi:hypothetical protein